MKPVFRVGVVAVGYIAAAILASMAVAIRVASTSGPDAQASSGMYAFGDALLFVAVLGVAGLVPTCVALFFLRPYRRFWVMLSGGGLTIALTGVAAVILFAVGRHAAEPSALATWAGLSVLRILIAPLCALVFLLSGGLSSYRVPRLALLGATVLELAVSAYGGYVWFVPLVFDRP